MIYNKQRLYNMLAGVETRAPLYEQKSEIKIWKKKKKKNALSRVFTDELGGSVKQLGEMSKFPKVRSQKPAGKHW